MRIIFLDFEGVLHGATELVDWPTSGLPLAEFAKRLNLLYWAPHLAKLLEGHGDVKIIVYSTWRKECRVEQLQALMGPLGPFVLGMTHRGLARTESIVDMVKRLEIEDYLIIDDDPSAFPPETHGLVICNPLAGVSDPSIQALIAQWLGPVEGETLRVTPT